jgi:hypothetical protein
MARLRNGRATATPVQGTAPPPRAQKGRRPCRTKYRILRAGFFPLVQICLKSPARGGIQRHASLLIPLATDAHFSLPLPNLQVFDAQSRCLADPQACL